MRPDLFERRGLASPPPALSVVAPCYNEEECLPEFLRRCIAACEAAVGDDFEIVLVNDGSVDQTWSLIRDASLKDARLVGVDLLRNHGHQVAVTAGLVIARGGRVLLIDADLQDPPELISDMMRRMDEGYDVVYGRRRRRAGESAFKVWSAALFYRMLGRVSQVDIPADVGDFRLMDRIVVDYLNDMPERHRFLRGMVAWVGGRQTEILYDRDPRYAGSTKYPLAKMVRFALDAFTSFSIAPLRFATVMAFIGVLFAIGFGMMVLWTYFTQKTAQGWTSLAVIVLFFSSAQLLAIGIIGEYLGRAYMQAKGRPMFMVRNIVRGPPAGDLASGLEKREAGTADAVSSRLRN